MDMSTFRDNVMNIPREDMATFSEIISYPTSPTIEHPTTSTTQQPTSEPFSDTVVYKPIFMEVMNKTNRFL